MKKKDKKMRDLVAQKLTESRFYQKIVPTKKGYDRKAEKRVEY
jgi:hypothetical protein